MYINGLNIKQPLNWLPCSSQSFVCHYGWDKSRFILLFHYWLLNHFPVAKAVRSLTASLTSLCLQVIKPPLLHLNSLKCTGPCYPVSSICTCARHVSVLMFCIHCSFRATCRWFIVFGGCSNVACWLILQQMHQSAISVQSITRQPTMCKWLSSWNRRDYNHLPALTPTFMWR